MRYLLILYLTFASAFCSGQQRWDNRLVPDKAIEVSPLHLLNFYPTIEVSYAQRIFRRYTVSMEFGYVLDYGDNYNLSFQDKRGVKLKTEGRYYFGRPVNDNRVFYAALEAYLNVINFDRYRIVTECFDLECRHPYQREATYAMDYGEHGVSVKMGTLRYVGARVFLDFNAGVTLRSVRYKDPTMPPALPDEFVPPFFPIPDQSNGIRIGPNMGLRLGYRFN